MAKFEVTGTATFEWSATIEADSLEDAKRLAEGLTTVEYPEMIGVEHEDGEADVSMGNAWMNDWKVEKVGS